MPLSKRQRKKREMESPAKTRRRERQKAKKLEKRLAEESQMAEYLKSNGWNQSGPMMDVWSIPGWDKPETCYATLRRAFRIQKKLESVGYVKPAGLDDDLGEDILG